MNASCVINPASGRAVKTTSKIGQKILKQSAKEDVKVNTMYKKPIGPYVENIPRILKTSDSNKKYKNLIFNKDGTINTKKTEIIDNPFWRGQLPTQKEIENMGAKTLIENMKEYLGRIHIYIKLNVKLEKEDEANFNALYPTIELYLKQMDKLKLYGPNIEKLIPTYGVFEKYYNKYMKLRKKIKGEKIVSLYQEDPTEYNKANIFPLQSSKPNYTKEGYFENVRDLRVFLKALIELKPELKKVYFNHNILFNRDIEKFNLSSFVKILHNIDKRIPPTIEKMEKLYSGYKSLIAQIFGYQERRR
jgi:hypothetical protein